MYFIQGLCFCCSVFVLLFNNVQNLVFVFGCVLWRWVLQIKLALAVQMCCLDVLDIARCLLLQPPMQCKKTWLCICKKKSSRWLDIWDMVKSVFFSASNATPKKQWLWVGKILHQGLMRSWLSVDDCLTNTGNKTGRQITPKATFTFFSSNVFLREFFYWFIVTIKFKRPNQTLSEKESFEERNIWQNFHSDNISSISTAREKEI